MLEFKLRDWMLPLLLLAFIGSTVTFLNPVFNTTSRWAILGILVIYVLLTRDLGQPFLSSFGLCTLLFALWIGATVMWSEVPLLSGIKASTFVVIAFSCMAAGQAWVRQHAPQAAVNYLLPLTLAALLAGVLGRFSEDSVIYGATTMTQGLVGGSNMFGSLLAMCFPLLLWQTYSHWKKRKERAFWLLLASTDIYYLFASGSRAAILVVLCTLLGFFLSLGGKRKAQLSLMAVGLLFTIFIISPSQFRQFEEVYVYKGSKDDGLFSTRDAVWEETQIGAEEGGLFGLGYGVSYGDKDFDFDITSVGYGREKGNSQLAIVEETGWVGLLIYMASLLALAGRLGTTLSRWPRGPEKVMLSMVAGTLVGMLVQSVFEAWWVAPGAPESVYFWSLTGVALGLTRFQPLPVSMAPPAGRTPAVNMAPPRPGRRPVSV